MAGEPSNPPDLGAPSLANLSSSSQQLEDNLKGTDFPPLPSCKQPVLEQQKISFWSNLFKSGPSSLLKTNLSSFQPQIEDGIAVIPDEIIEEGTNEWKDYVVGYFVGKRLPFMVVKEALKKQWNLKGSYDLVADSELFYLKFSMLEDRQSVLDVGPVFIAGRVFVLQQWSDKIEKPKQRAQTMPIWVHLTGVPKCLWTSNGLSFLASLIGVPICSDEATANKSRLNYARVCVEMKAGDEFPRVIKAKTKEGDVEEISVEYPWKPASCADCCKFGHNTANCTFNKVWVPKKVVNNVPGEDQVVDITNLGRNFAHGNCEYEKYKGKNIAGDSENVIVHNGEEQDGITNGVVRFVSDNDLQIAATQVFVDQSLDFVPCSLGKDMNMSSPSPIPQKNSLNALMIEEPIRMEVPQENSFSALVCEEPHFSEDDDVLKETSDANSVNFNDENEWSVKVRKTSRKATRLRMSRSISPPRTRSKTLNRWAIQRRQSECEGASCP